MSWSLLGQEALYAVLSRILKSGRFPHALLLTGPALGGKFSLAVDLAKALNCLNPGSDGSPCGVCLSCRKIDEGNHPDFMVCQPVGNTISIEDVRGLQERLSFKPYEGQYRTAIIKEADSFQSAAASALLKTLEEPAVSTVIILTAISESRVMNTLVSRCVRLKVPPLGRENILRALKDRRALDGPRADLLAGLSGGAMGAALTLDPEECWGIWTKLDSLYGQTLGSEAVGLKAAGEWSAQVEGEIKKFRKIDSEESKKGSQGFSQVSGALRRAYVTKIMTFLRLWWRDTIILAATGDKKRFHGPPPTPAQRKWAALLDMKKFDEYLKAIDLMENSFNRFIREEVVLLNYWLKVLTFHRQAGLKKPK